MKCKYILFVFFSDIKKAGTTVVNDIANYLKCSVMKLTDVTEMKEPQSGGSAPIFSGPSSAEINCTAPEIEANCVSPAPTVSSEERPESRSSVRSGGMETRPMEVENNAL